uniref:sensor histidine kinase n=1 Tax=Cellulomonas citrea TaxID=1909423 RepID=UPI0019162457
DAPTETRALAQAIDQALADRARAERRLRDFVADAAHELRTPLTSVHGWADLYQQGALTGPEVDRAFERIGAQTSRMRHLVDQLALLARLDADVPLARTTVDLRALVDDVVDDLAVLAPDRPVTWHRPDSPVLVDGDAARLAQVVQNLVGNVLRHTPGTAALRLDLAVDGASAELVVADDGPGIPADLVPHVLDRFVRRSRPDRPDEAEGSGLGLAIVDGLVRAHHGTLTLDSAPDAGTTVQVRLPLRAPGA